MRAMAPSLGTFPGGGSFDEILNGLTMGRLFFPTGSQNGRELNTKPGHGIAAGLLPGIEDRPVIPVDILSAQAGVVSMRASRIPEHLVLVAALWIWFLGEDILVLFARDAPLLAESDLRPELLGANGRRQPNHIQGEVVLTADKANPGVVGSPRGGRQPSAPRVQWAGERRDVHPQPCSVG